MTVTFLKAGSGDSILINHAKKNILIDGGNDSTFLQQQVNLIFDKSEVLDLIIITHHDDDHIKGIIDLLNMIQSQHYDKKPNALVKKVLFNAPDGSSYDSEKKELSYRQAFEVKELLTKHKINWEGCTENSTELQFEDLELLFLSPTEKDRGQYEKKSGEYLTSDFRCDWKTPLKKLEKYIDDESQDTSPYNRSSIVVLCKCAGKKILLPGDVTPKRLEAIARNLRKDNNNEPIELDFMPLPHHGSYRNLTKKILQDIKCFTFIVSTNSQKHNLPNKRSLLKIIKHLNREDRQNIHFLFNYQEALSKLNISEEEKKYYRFKTSPNNTDHGLVM